MPVTSRQFPEKDDRICCRCRYVEIVAKVASVAVAIKSYVVVMLVWSGDTV
jgi:hypothetical protein